MTPVERMHLDRRIAEENFVELLDHGREPEIGLDIMRVRVMRTDGSIDANWYWSDCVPWADTAAIQCETGSGMRIDDPLLPEDWDDDYD